MKILFMGTPEFSVPCLEALTKSEYEVVGVVTQPDKPKGRGHKMLPPPVKEFAQENGIKVYQPETLKDNALLGVLNDLKPDLIVVVAYGKILPEYVLDFPKYGCINVHASLLPKYRGAGPIQWSIINGESETGVTTMFMSEGLDTGDMILKSATEISAEDTAGTLHDRLSVMGAKLLLETVEKLADGTAERTPQDDSLSNYAPMISKETGRIDWTKPMAEVVNLIRGTNPWPIAHTTYQGTPMKVIFAKAGRACDGKPGEILGLTADKELEVACGNKESIYITEIQMSDSKRMNVRDYLNGHTIDLNEVLI